MAQLPQNFDINDAIVQRSPVRASLVDGAMLRGYRYQQIIDPKSRRKNLPLHTTPLLCLASEFGNSREHHRFALALASQSAAVQKTYTLDMRGRGYSDAKGLDLSDAATDADDLISFCDAHNLHHIDLVVTGFSVFVFVARHHQTTRSGSKAYPERRCS